jgi:hypothetical protein
VCLLATAPCRQAWHSRAKRRGKGGEQGRKVPSNQQLLNPATLAFGHY